ncbi:MAG: class I SAM-dependent methyltransferase [Tsuneonella sp.]
MGLGRFYDQRILPRVITYCCGQEEIGELRAKLVPLAEGSVLELGCGGGLNQQYYDAARVNAFAGVDPSAALLDQARRSAQAKGWDTDIRQGVGEALPFGDDSFDTVVCTYTLCSVSDHARTIAEMRRVLKPGGRLLFLEHGRAPDPAPRKWQGRIEPVWKHLAGNCHLTRQIGPALGGGGFSVEPLGQQYLAKAPRWAGWMEWGIARK